MKFKIPVEWVMTATLEIEADDIESAFDKANLVTPIPDGEYLSDSYQVNIEAAYDLNAAEEK